MAILKSFVLLSVLVIVTVSSEEGEPIPHHVNRPQYRIAPAEATPIVYEMSNGDEEESAAESRRIYTLLRRTLDASSEEQAEEEKEETANAAHSFIARTANRLRNYYNNGQKIIYGEGADTIWGNPRDPLYAIMTEKMTFDLPAPQAPKTDGKKCDCNRRPKKTKGNGQCSLCSAGGGLQRSRTLDRFECEHSTAPRVFRVPSIDPSTSHLNGYRFVLNSNRLSPAEAARISAEDANLAVVEEIGNTRFNKVQSANKNTQRSCLGKRSHKRSTLLSSESGKANVPRGKDHEDEGEEQKDTGLAQIAEESQGNESKSEQPSTSESLEDSSESPSMLSRTLSLIIDGLRNLEKEYMEEQAKALQEATSANLNKNQLVQHDPADVKQPLVLMF